MKSEQWKTYRTRFLVKAKQLSSSLSFVDHLGRQHCGRKGDYLVESSDGVLSIAPRRIFEDIYVPMTLLDTGATAATRHRGLSHSRSQSQARQVASGTKADTASQSSAIVLDICRQLRIQDVQLYNASPQRTHTPELLRPARESESRFRASQDCARPSRPRVGSSPGTTEPAISIFKPTATPAPAVNTIPKGEFCPFQQITPAVRFPQCGKRASTPHQARHC